MCNILILISAFLINCSAQSGVIGYRNYDLENKILTSMLLNKLFYENDNYETNQFKLESEYFIVDACIISNRIDILNYRRAFLKHIAVSEVKDKFIIRSIEQDIVLFKMIENNVFELVIKDYTNRKPLQIKLHDAEQKNVKLNDTKFGISIVIPTFNRLNECVACIHMLKSSINAPKNAWEVIVVADGCTDGTGTYLLNLFKNDGFDNFRVIWTDKEPGVYRNAGWPENSGVRAAKFSHVALCDCDVYHLCDPVSPTLKLLENDPNIVVVGILYSVHSPLSVQYSESSSFKLEPFKWNDKCEPGWFVIPRSQFIEIGGNSEEFNVWGYEDEDLINRFEKLGLRKVRSEEIICAWRYEKNDKHKGKGFDNWNINYNKVRNNTSVKRNENKPNWGKFYTKPLFTDGKILFSEGL